DSPGVLEHFRPLGARIDLDLDRVDLELLRLFRVDLLARGGSDRPALFDAIEKLLGVGRNLEVIDLGEQRLRLAVLQVEPLERRLAVRRPKEEDLTLGPGPET